MGATVGILSSRKSWLAVDVEGSPHKRDPVPNKVTSSQSSLTYMLVCSALEGRLKPDVEMSQVYSRCRSPAQLAQANAGVALRRLHVEAMVCLDAQARA